MAYVGTPLDTTNAFQSLDGKRFSGDASTTNFTLDSSPNSTLDIGGTNVAATAAELNIMDGGTSATSTTLVNADRLVANDNGTMVQVALSDLKTYLTSAGFSSEDPTALAIALG